LLEPLIREDDEPILGADLSVRARGHARVFGVLAMESEPVDPRL